MRFAPYFLLGVCAATQFACANRTVSAAPPSVAEDAADAPTAAPRLAYLQGSVSFRAAGIDEWSAAELNRPLTNGDALWAGADGRVEVESGSTAMRLSTATSIEILNLRDNLMQISLTEGTLNVRLRRLDAGEEFEVDTPHSAVVLLRPGEYRFEVDTASTRVISRSGEARIGGITLRQGEQAGITQGGQPVISGAPPRDEFDSFCAVRDEHQDRAPSLQYVSPELTGRGDLDDHGSWRVDAAYGPVWAPRRVPSGWAPYRFGHWVWIEPWGWTWVDDTPWGFAPFHYGRWVLLQGAVWVWVPGPRLSRPLYSPALVVFAGGGRPGKNFFFWVGASAGVAWFPLGPGDPYFPPYRYSRRYLVNINVTNTVIRNPRFYDIDPSRHEYRNQRLAGAITVVPRDGFTRGRNVGPLAMRVPDRDLGSLRVHGGAAPVAPSRESVSPRREPSARPPAAASRPVITRREPTRIEPFERRQPDLERSPGKPQPSVRERPAPRGETKADQRRSEGIRRERQKESEPARTPREGSRKH